MAKIPVPSALDLSDPEQASENWAVFKNQWQNYEILLAAGRVRGQDFTSNEVRVALFITLLGNEGIKLLNKLGGTDGKEIEEIIAVLDRHFKSTRNVIFERFIFNSMSQDGVPVKTFVERLRNQVSKCSFNEFDGKRVAEIEEILIRDRLVAGLSDSNLRKRLLLEKCMNLQNTIDLCTTDELASKCAVQLESAKGGHDQEVLSTTKKGISDRRNFACKYCGSSHDKGAKNCPAFGKVCKTCKKRNHFSRVCQRRHVRSVSTDKSDSSSEKDIVYSIGKGGKKQLFANLKVRATGKTVVLKCQLDSGASCNIIGLKELQGILGTKCPRLESSQANLCFYGGSSVRSLGRIKLRCKLENVTHKIYFEVMHTYKPTLLGSEDCLKLGLLTTSELVYQMNSSSLLDGYEDVFEGLGCFEGKYNIDTDQTIKPVIAPPRRVPVALIDEVKQEINRLVTLGVLRKETGPTEWVSNMVVVKKPNKIRICLDPHFLNKATKRSHYQTPTIEQILPQLDNSKIFSLLDLKDGFWQTELTDESSKLTTFWTPWGRYRWTRLPFGVDTAPEEFQRRIHEAIEGLAGVDAIADDIVVYGKGDTREEAQADHDANLRALLQRARNKNFKFNKQKSRIGLSEITFMGHVVSDCGVRPDPKKISAVKDMKAPENKEELLRFLGFINYLGKFIPHLTEVAGPLRDLIKDEAQWIWDTPQDEAFRKLVSLVTSAPTLKYFEVNKEAVLQCDASQYGLGACLMQDGKPVAYASKAMTKTEMAYAQIDKECLAIVFGFERFEQYLLGNKEVTVETDHKPLETILKKPISCAPKRLQRMMLRLQRFSFTVFYKPGKAIPVADFLSRAPVEKEGSGFDRDRGIIIFQADDGNQLQYLNVTDERIQEIAEETSKDQVARRLIRIIQVGWPEERKILDKELHEFWGFRDELSIEDGVILKGERIYIPQALRNKIIKMIHSPHLGTESSVRRAKGVFFWPRMRDDIKLVISRCHICMKFAPDQQKESLNPHDTPERPWQYVAADYFQLGSEYFIIITDYYSSFFEIKKVTSLKTSGLVQFCKSLFSRYGIPDKVVCDSGSQLLSKEFKNFAKAWKFQIKPSSPYHHQSNGKAESAVKIAKNIIRKVKEERGDLELALLEWRNIPLQNLNASPAQLFFSRMTKTLIPTSEIVLKPKLQDNVTKRLFYKKEIYKKHYDKTAKDLKLLVSGQEVWVQLKPDDKKATWSKGKIVRGEGERRYLVEVDGRLYRRNRKFLRS